MGAREVRIIPVRVESPVGEGDDLAAIVADRVALEDGDVVVVSSSALSCAEARRVRLEDVAPGNRAREIAGATGKDARVVELVLANARRVCVERGILIAENGDGGVCANGGIDRSNAGPGNALLLPEDPDGSARRLQVALGRISGRRVGVVVSDSHGRPLRRGCIGVAVGAAGVRALWDRKGDRDLFGRRLESTVVALGDLLASAAQLVMGEADEGVPAAVVRGLDAGGAGRGADLIRPAGEEIFRPAWSPAR